MYQSNTSNISKVIIYLIFPSTDDHGPDVVERPPPDVERPPPPPSRSGIDRPPPPPSRSGIDGHPFQPRVINYSHLPEHLWPTINFVIPANFQELVAGQVLVLPVRMTVQLAPTEEGLQL